MSAINAERDFHTQVKIDNYVIVNLKANKTAEGLANLKLQKSFVFF